MCGEWGFWACLVKCHKIRYVIPVPICSFSLEIELPAGHKAARCRLHSQPPWQLDVAMISFWWSRGCEGHPYRKWMCLPLSSTSCCLDVDAVSHSGRELASGLVEQPHRRNPGANTVCAISSLRLLMLKLSNER